MVTSIRAELPSAACRRRAASAGMVAESRWYHPKVVDPPRKKRRTGRDAVDAGGQEIWADTFRTGEANMSHSIANIEHHPFKYRAFRRPGDVHCHFFGAATLSCSAGVQARPGDVFEIAAPGFGRPLRNALALAAEEARPVGVRVL